MNETGTVVRVDEDYLILLMTRSEACLRCGACGAGRSRNEMVLRVKNTCGAQEGDFVQISIKEGAFLKASLLAYGLPLLIMFAGFLFGGPLALLLGMAEYDALFRFSLGALLLGVSYLMLNLFSKKLETPYTPRAVCVCDENGRPVE